MIMPLEIMSQTMLLALPAICQQSDPEFGYTCTTKHMAIYACT